MKEALTAFQNMKGEALKGSPYETDYKRLSPTPNEFPHFVTRVIRLSHVAEMFRAKGGDVFGDLRPRSSSRLAILPNTTHVSLMQRLQLIVPMINDFLDAK